MSGHIQRSDCSCLACETFRAAAYGERIKTDKAYETQMNTQVLQSFLIEVKKRQPQAIVELGIMDLYGAVEPVT